MASSLPMGRRRLISSWCLGWLLPPLAFVHLPSLASRRPAMPAEPSRVTMHVDIPGRLLQGYQHKTKRGPPKTHLPTGGPNVTKTADLMELRTSYAVDNSHVVREERRLLQELRSDDVEERRNASEVLLRSDWPGRPQRTTLLKLLEAVAEDHDLIVRENIGHLLRQLCVNFRWEMDEWVALLAQKINPQSTQDIVTQIYVMKALGILGPYANSYSSYISKFFEHEQEYVRMVAVETVGQLTLEVPRHKRNLVRLLKEDQSEQVRLLCDRVLKQRGWREPHWMRIQKPAWRERVIRANANKGKGTTKGKRSEGKFGKLYWEKINNPKAKEKRRW